MTKRNGKSPPLRGNKEAQQALILKVIAKAGPEGILRVQIAEKTKLGVKVVARGLEALAGKVYVAAWPHSGSCRFPAYAIGPGPDVPRPAPSRPKVDRCPGNVEALMHADVESEHARWAAGWVAHPDPAAAWLRAAA